MSENAEKKEGGEKKEHAKGKKPAGGPTPAELLAAEKKKKKAWTLDKCLKTARRFQSESEWATGAPAAYKSAIAHGWTKQCVAGMTGAKSTHRKTA